MDSRIINDAFEKEPHICSGCDCLKGNHLVFVKCPIFENNPLCLDCCQTDALKNDIDKKFSEKLGRLVTKEWINEQCKNCGLNNAKQNQDLAENLEKGFTGDNNGQSPQIKTR